MRFLGLIKPLIVLLGGGFGAWITGQQVYIALTEKAPTNFTAEQFAADYRGQHWIGVSGRLAVEARSEKPAHNRPDWVDLYVPVVPETWTPQDPVHVVAAMESMPAAAVGNWARAAGPPRPFVGTIQPLGGPNYSYLFPRLRFSSPTVCINENSHPQPPLGMGIGLAFCLVLCAYAGRMIWQATAR